MLDIPFLAIVFLGFYKGILNDTEVKDVYENELSKIDGIASAKVEAGPDKLLGMLAKLSIKLKNDTDVKAVQEQIKHELGRYTVKYKIEEIGE